MKRKVSIIVKINNHLIRQQEHEGRKYIIAPVVLLTEGVHHGSAGRVYHSPVELSSNWQTWNGIPVTVGHPRDDNGEPVSANKPEIAEKYRIGILYNVEYQVNPPRLVGEIWIDVEMATKKSPESISELNSGKLEVSSGMYHDEIEQSGVWNDEEFDSIAVDYRPDHLAVLPGYIGACSWEDGCGAPRVNSSITFYEGGVVGGLNKEKIKKFKEERLKRNELSYGEIGKEIQKEIDTWDKEGIYHIVEDVYQKFFVFSIYNANQEQVTVSYFSLTYKIDSKDKIVLSNVDEKKEVKRKTEWINANEISDEEKRTELRSLIREQEQEEGVYVWVVEVFEDYFIYEISNEIDGAEKYFRLSYKKSGDEITIADITSKEEVELKKEWILVSENKENKKEEDLKVKTKEQRIEALIACNNCPFTEQDKDFLTSLSEERLKAFEENVSKKSEGNDGSDDPEGNDGSGDPKGNGDLKGNDDPKGTSFNPKNINDYPEEIRKDIQDLRMLVAHYREREKEDKEKLVKFIGENRANVFTTEELNKMEIPMLNNLAKMITGNNNLLTDYSMATGGQVPRMSTNAMEDYEKMDDPEPIFLEDKGGK